MNEFGNAMRRARRAADLTLQDVSKSVGKSIGYLSDLERRNRNVPPLELAQKLQDVLGMEGLFRLAQIERALSPAEVYQTLERFPAIKEQLRKAVESSCA